MRTHAMCLHLRTQWLLTAMHLSFRVACLRQILKAGNAEKSGEGGERGRKVRACALNLAVLGELSRDVRDMFSRTRQIWSSETNSENRYKFTHPHRLGQEAALFLLSTTPYLWCVLSTTTFAVARLRVARASVYLQSTASHAHLVLHVLSRMRMDFPQ